MKAFLILFLFLLAFKGMAQTLLQGQATGSSKNQAQTLQVPFSQSTKVSTTSSLIETGNFNQLNNPGGESITDAGWVGAATGTATCNIAGTLTSTVPPLFGKGVVYARTRGGASGGTCTLYQDVPVPEGLDTEVSVWLSSSSSTQYTLYMRKDGVNVASTATAVTQDGKYRLYKFQSIAGATSMGIGITITLSAVADRNIQLDEAYVGYRYPVHSGQQITAQSSLLITTGSLADGATVTGTMSRTSGSGIYSYASGIYTVLKKAKFTLIGTARTAASSIARMSIVINGAGSASGNNAAGNAGVNAAVGHTEVLEAGSTFYFAVGDATLGSPSYVSVSATAIESTSTISWKNKTITAWESFAASGSWAAATYSGRMRRVGDTVELQYKLLLTGTPTGNLNLNMPPGLVADTTKLSASNMYGTAYNLPGTSQHFDATGTVWDGPVILNGGLILPLVDLSNGTYSQWDDIDPAVPYLWAVNDTLTLNTRVPIVGWEATDVAVIDINGMVRTPDERGVLRYSGRVSATGTVTKDRGDLINGNCTISGTSLYQCNFNTSKILSPDCQFTVIRAGAIGRGANIVSVTNSLFSIYTDSGGTQEANEFSWACDGDSP